MHPLLFFGEGQTHAIDERPTHNHHTHPLVLFFHHTKQNRFDVHFALPLPSPRLFGVDKYNPELNAEADARGITRHHQTVLVAVDGRKKEATFKKIGGEGEGEEFSLPFAMLHVTPPMSAPDFVRAGPLVNENVSWRW